MIKVKTNFDGAFKFLQKLEKQSRYAAAVALTRTAQAVAKREAEEVARAFDRPVPFTSKAFVVKRATTASLRAEVVIRDRQADYLKPHIDGGDRKPKRHEVLFTADARAPRSYWVPAQGVDLNAHGNVSRAQIKKLAVLLRHSGKHGDVFYGTPKPGMPIGIYGRKMRSGKKVLSPLLLLMKRAPRYKKRFKFFEVGYSTAAKELPAQFNKAWNEALRTAKWF